MQLKAGARIGPYEVTGVLGAGGMGEVYRARDTRLLRDVALKLLPEPFATDPMRLARFEREAQVLASLSHPNIAGIYGVEEHGGKPVLVLEFVGGLTLSERIASGPLALDEALAMTRQLADALRATHEQGIVHRDLKPANVKIDSGGTVKVLDFGIAKLVAPTMMEGTDAGGTVAPQDQAITVSTPLLAAGGAIIGTIAYMSPEQARGGTVDKRTDIWALGCVLFEMLTGARAFAGEGTADTLAAILTKEPDWHALPAHTPSSIRRLLRHCIEKDPRRRLQDIGDARFDIEEAVDAPPVTTAIVRPRLSIGLLAIAIAAAVLVASVLTSLFWRTLLQSQAAVPQVVRFALSLPAGQQLLDVDHRVIDISPDGGQVAYATPKGIYIRSLAETQPKLLAGTDLPEPPFQPTFSRDGTFIVFRSGNQYYAITLAGHAAPQMLTRPAMVNAPPARGGALVAWGRQIVSIGFGQSGFTLSQLEALGSAEHFVRPQLLPDEDTLLFALAAGDSDERWDEAGIISVSRTSHNRGTLSPFNLAPTRASDALHLPTGHVVFASLGSLNAARLDSKLRYFATPSVRVLDGVRQTRRFGSTGDAQFSVAANGTLVYVPESRTPQSSAGRSRYSMALIDRQGGTQALAGLTGWFPRVSPDGRRLAVETVTSQGRGISVFTLDTPGSLSQLTVGGSHRFPVWSPDSQRVAYQSDRLDSDRAVFWQRIDRLEPAQRLTTPAPDAAHVPLAMSRDGRTLLFDEEQGPTHTLCALSLQDGTIQRFTDVTSNALISAALSRDGRWLAYSAHRSPRPASVIVEPFPRTGAKYVDVGQGDHPAWSSTGTELFYMRGDRFVTRRVISASGFSAGDAVEVPRPFVSYGSSMPRPYDIVPQNRIVASPVSEPEPPGVSIQVVLNWLDEVKRLVP